MRSAGMRHARRAAGRTSCILGVIAIVVAIAACGGEGDPNTDDAVNDPGDDETDPGDDEPTTALPAMRSGSRLTVRRTEVATGIGPVYSRFFDEELDDYCWVRPDTTGKLRCLPRPVSVLFVDAECTEPIIQVNSSTAPTTTFVNVETLGTCGTDHQERHSLYRAGEGIENPSQVYTMDFGTCNPSLTMGSHAFAAISVDPSEFVAVEEQFLPETSRLARQTFLGSDGSVLHGDDVLDRDFGVKCEGTTKTDGEWRCSPVATYAPPTTRVYSGDSCTGDSARALLTTCETAQALSYDTVSGGACDTRQYYATGSEIDSASADSGDLCIAVTGTFGEASFAAEELVAATEFASLSLSSVGDERVEARRMLSDDGTTVLEHYYDTQLDTRCDVTYTDDGSGNRIDVCAPASMYITPAVYAEGSCTERAEVGLFKADPCTSEPIPNYLGGGWYAGVLRFWERGPVYDGPIFVLDGDTCIETDDINSVWSNGPFTLYSRGQEIPVADLAVAQVVEI